MSSSSSLQQIVTQTLASYARFGVDLGLDRIERVLAALGHPQQQVPIIHVAGTNGKGSVCAYLAAVLTAAGYRTGRYTSPHLVQWTERICIDNEPISWPALQASLAAVEAVIDTTGSALSSDLAATSAQIPTQFEVFTAAAWHYFATQQVDIAIVEVGLGGRLDATNVCDHPLATIIVSIGRDHWQRLGPTLADIAGEKAGILKPLVPAIAGPLPPEAEAVITARAEALSAPLTWVKPAEPIASKLSEESEKSTQPAIPHLDYQGLHYPQMLLGEHQRVNSACAIAALQALRDQDWHIPDSAIISGMAQAQWPGRLQRSQWQGHTLLIDGAHNTDAAHSLRAYLDSTFPQQPVTWLMGLLETKDHAGIFHALLRAGDRLHLVPVPGHLSAQPKTLADLAQQVCPNLQRAEIHPNLETGLVAATTATATSTATAASTAAPTVFCGSLYLIGHFFEKF